MGLAYNNGSIEVCDYVCVWFVLNPRGTTPLPLPPLPPPHPSPKNKARHCIQKSPF